MSNRDDTLLLRRYRSPQDVSTNIPRPDQPIRAGDPAGGFPQPPALNRQVQSVYDARLPFTREFWKELRNRQVPLSGDAGVFVFTDFSFAVPNGYLGVLRELRVIVDSFAQQADDGEIFFAVLLQGQPIADLAGETLNGGGPPQPGILVDDGQNSANTFGWTGKIQPFYLEVPPGGSFGIRLFNNLVPPGGETTFAAQVDVFGQFVRAENVPTEMQIAQPPQVTPTVPATFG